MTLSFAEDGAELHAAALSHHVLVLLAELAENFIGDGPGVRISGNRALSKVLAAEGSLDKIAISKLGDQAQPVRAVLFDKTAASNWALGWHQDRTIVVDEKRAVPGFGPWSRKAGLVHVEPPFDIIARMITLRAHLDDCGEDNGPLKIVPGSHRIGRVPGDETAGAAGQMGTAICVANAGDVWLYATSIVHASSASRKPDRRRVLQVDYASEELPGGLKWLGV